MSKIMDISTLVENGHTDVEFACSSLLEAIRYFEHTDEGSRNYMRSEADHIMRLLLITNDYLNNSLKKT